MFSSPASHSWISFERFIRKRLSINKSSSTYIITGDSTVGWTEDVNPYWPLPNTYCLCRIQARLYQVGCIYTNLMLEIQRSGKLKSSPQIWQMINNLYYYTNIVVLLSWVNRVMTITHVHEELNKSILKKDKCLGQFPKYFSWWEELNFSEYLV